MSWQFNPLLGPQIHTEASSTSYTTSTTTTTKTSSPFSTPPIVQADHAAAVGANIVAAVISDKDLASARLSSTTVLSPYETPNNLASISSPSSSSLVAAIDENLKSNEDPNKQEFLYRLLDHHRLESKMEPESSFGPHKIGTFSASSMSENRGDSLSTNIQAVSSSEAARAQQPSKDLIVDQSSSFINHLLPNQPVLPSWSTFTTMPLYSPSFEMDGHIECSSVTSGDDAAIQHQQHDSSFHNSGTNQNATQSSLLSPGHGNLINRFNQTFRNNTNSNAIFSSPTSSGEGSIGEQRGSESYRRGETTGGVRSYSSVLHSQPQPPMTGRYSMFGMRDSVLDSQANYNQRLDGHILQQQQQQLQQQQQYQQQLRQMSEFSSSVNHQQTNYPTQQHQRFAHNPSTSQVGTTNGPKSVALRGQHENSGPTTFGSRGYLPDKGAVVGGRATDANTSTNTSHSGVANKRRSKLPFLSNSNSSDGQQHSLKVDLYGAPLVNSDGSERYSRKVFVGGLPPDIDEEEIKASFRRFGTLLVDWPHKAESKSYFPPKGYAFLLFHEESSVQALINACIQEEDKLYLCVSSPTIKDKPVQIRPWRLSDADYVLDSTLALDPRKTIFVGGVPRPLKASELANIMNNLYGGVCYAGIDTDPELKYPKGAGRVAFSNHQSYIAAISARFVHLQHCEIEKRVEVKPYVLDDQFCDECQGARCANKFAPFFCANITCLQYYCENCWSTVHSQPGRAFHKPLVKEGADRPRGVPVRWCQ